MYLTDSHARRGVMTDWNEALSVFRLWLGQHVELPLTLWDSCSQNQNNGWVCNLTQCEWLTFEPTAIGCNSDKGATDKKSVSNAYRVCYVCVSPCAASLPHNLLKFWVNHITNMYTMNFVRQHSQYALLVLTLINLVQFLQWGYLWTTHQYTHLRISQIFPNQPETCEMIFCHISIYYLFPGKM